MKRKMYAMLLIAAMAVSIIGCSVASNDATTAAATTAETTTTAEAASEEMTTAVPTTTPEETTQKAIDYSEFYGTWKMVGAAVGDKIVKSSEIPEDSSIQEVIDTEIVVADDHKASVYMPVTGEVAVTVWSEQDEGILLGKLPVQIMEGYMILHVEENGAMVLSKVSNSQELRESSPETTEAETEAEVGEDFKKMVDDFEEFFDEYVEFMKKYSKNPTDLSLMCKALDIMSKYTDYMSKFEAIKDTEMNSAEAIYYAEAALRIEKKLLEVLK